MAGLLGNFRSEISREWAPFKIQKVKGREFRGKKFEVPFKVLEELRVLRQGEEWQVTLARLFKDLRI